MDQNETKTSRRPRNPSAREHVWLRCSTAAVLLLAACSSTDVALLTADERPIAELAPAPYRVWIAEIEVPESVSGAPDADKWRLSTFQSDELRGRLVTAARSMRTASAIDTFTGGEGAQSIPEDVDLVVRPKLMRADFTYSGLSDDALSSGCWWLFTWIGGTFVSDCSYDTALTLDCQVRDRNTDVALSEASFQSGEASLDFWSRNDATSLGFLETLVCPPFWTQDDGELTSSELTDRAFLHVAASLKQHLRSDLPRKLEETQELRVALAGKVQNGASVGESMDLECEVAGARGAVSAVVYVKQAGDPEFREAAQNTDYAEIVLGEGALQPLTVKGLRMKAGENLVRLWAEDSQGRVATRTFRFQVE